MSTQSLFELELDVSSLRRELLNVRPWVPFAVSDPYNVVNNPNVLWSNNISQVRPKGRQRGGRT